MVLRIYIQLVAEYSFCVCVGNLAAKFRPSHVDPDPDGYRVESVYHLLTYRDERDNTP